VIRDWEHVRALLAIKPLILTIAVIAIADFELTMVIEAVNPARAVHLLPMLEALRVIVVAAGALEG